jgi:hypothetical protein
VTRALPGGESATGGGGLLQGGVVLWKSGLPESGLNIPLNIRLTLSDALECPSMSERRRETTFRPT